MFFWQRGGGLVIFGTATLTNTNVHDNQADEAYTPSRTFREISSSASLTNSNVYQSLSALASLVLYLAA